MTNLFVVETSYYDVLLAREQVKVQQKAVEPGEQLLREVRRQVQVGTLAQLEVTSAESVLESSKSALAGAEGVYAVAKNTLKNLITDKLVQSADVNLRYLYNQLFPGLNLTGTYGWYTFNQSFGGHLDEVKHGPTRITQRR